MPLPHALRRDAVLGVVGDLLLAAAVGLRHGALHRAGDRVGIEDHPAVDVARGAADGLDQRGLAAQEAFLVGVEDRDQRAFGNVEALAQQVDADQRVEGAEPQVADDLDALQGVDVGVHVAHADALLVQVFGEVLGHALGQHGDERAVAARRDLRAPRRRGRRPGCGPGGSRPADRSGRSGGSPARRTRRRTGRAPSRPASPRPRPSAAASRPIPRTAAAGCPCRTAGGSRIRRASPCGGSRRDTCRRAAGW